jgi:hypothetical protein
MVLSIEKSKITTVETKFKTKYDSNNSNFTFQFMKFMKFKKYNKWVLQVQSNIFNIIILSSKLPVYKERTFSN